jgi:hypothetical protein
MPTANALRDVPILLIDAADFTSRYAEVEGKRALLQHLQRILTDSARFFMPYGDVWSKWTRHGTGDGYYFVLDALPPQVALKYALAIGDALLEHNRQHGRDLPVRLRLVLAYGDVEWVDDQILSQAFAVAERFISFEPFKGYARTRAHPAALAMTSLISRGSPNSPTCTGRRSRSLTNTALPTQATYSAQVGTNPSNRPCRLPSASRF